MMAFAPRGRVHRPRNWEYEKWKQSFYSEYTRMEDPNEPGSGKFLPKAQVEDVEEAIAQHIERPERSDAALVFMFPDSHGPWEPKPKRSPRGKNRNNVWDMIPPDLEDFPQKGLDHALGVDKGSRRAELRARGMRERNADGTGSAFTLGDDTPSAKEQHHHKRMRMFTSEVQKQVANVIYEDSNLMETYVEVAAVKVHRGYERFVVSWRNSAKVLPDEQLSELLEQATDRIAKKLYDRMELRHFPFILFQQDTSQEDDDELKALIRSKFPPKIAAGMDEAALRAARGDPRNPPAATKALAARIDPDVAARALATPADGEQGGADVGFAGDEDAVNPFTLTEAEQRIVLDLRADEISVQRRPEIDAAVPGQQRITKPRRRATDKFALEFRKRFREAQRRRAEDARAGRPASPGSGGEHAKPGSGAED